MSEQQTISPRLFSVKGAAAYLGRKLQELTEDVTTVGNPHQAEATLTTDEAAQYIGMSKSFLAISRMDGERMNRTPGPPYVKIGKRVLYLREDLDSWLRDHRVPSVQ